LRWFRMYSEILDDPKVARVTDSQFRIFIYLLAAASECDREGFVQLRKYIAHLAQNANGPLSCGCTDTITRWIKTKNIPAYVIEKYLESQVA